MSDLKAKQRIVGVGAASGALSALGIVLLVYHYLPPFQGMETLDGRLALALRCCSVAVLPLLAGIGQVANTRFLTEAIDPTAGAEDRRMIVHGRYVENTLQQFVLFVVGTMALCTFVSAEGMRLLPALTAVFVLGRIAFWVGYLRHPLLRAPGMAATMYPSVIVLGYVVYRIIIRLW